VVKKILKIIGIVVISIAVVVGLVFGYLTIREFNPESVETLEVQSSSNSKGAIQANSEISILTWNIGYCGLDQSTDFFLDGGTHSGPTPVDEVNNNINGVVSTLQGDAKSDICFIQEVDVKSSRTHKIDESAALSFTNSSFAYNYKCDYIPYPLPPIGTVAAGIMTLSDYDIESAERIALPCPFGWPYRIATLKRCLVANYIPIENSDKYLVAVNLHLEAYDSGEGKIEQTRILTEFIQSEYEKGNYVIAGGDFNQLFPETTSVFPNTHTDLWVPGELEYSSIPDGWSFAFDNTYPSCRLLNQPYNPADTEGTQYYIIDGFIVSPNVEIVSVNTIHSDFEFSDHNPVQLKVVLN